MTKQEHIPAILSENPKLLRFIGDMTLEDYICRFDGEIKEYVFYFGHCLCVLRYNPSDNWMFIEPQTNDSSLSKQLVEDILKWASPCEPDFELRPDNSLTANRWRFFKPAEQKFFKMPIDNKHICEDFTDDFHDGNYVEFTALGKRVQAFTYCNCLCTISYTFGGTSFDLAIIDGDPGRYDDVRNHWKNVITNCNHVEDGEGTYVKEYYEGHYGFVQVYKE